MANLYSKNGQVVVLFAGVLLVLLFVAGLAIDVGVLYGVKTKLQAAVDGAALAAGRVISLDTHPAELQAGNFLNANFPVKFLGSTLSGQTVTASQGKDKAWNISVTATATVPTYFAKVFGWNSFSVLASSSTTVRSLDLVLVLDTSGSMVDADIANLQQATTNFLQSFDPSYTRIGMIHFASGVIQDVQISTSRWWFDKAGLTSAIGGLRPGGSTTSEEALRLAKLQLDSIPDYTRSSLRAIVFFTDGAPNCFYGKFMNGSTEVAGALDSGVVGPPPAYQVWDISKQNITLGQYYGIATLPATDYSGQVNLQSYNSLRSLSTAADGSIPNTGCNVNIASRNMLENVANDARSETGNPIYIFTVGLGSQLRAQEFSACYAGDNSAEYGENILRRVANVSGVDTFNKNQPSGLYFWAGSSSQLQSAFTQIANYILRISN